MVYLAQGLHSWNPLEIWIHAGLLLSGRMASYNCFRTPKSVPRTSENFYVRPKIYINTSHPENIPPSLGGFLDVCPAFLTAFHVNCVQRTSHFPLTHILLTVRCHMAAYVYSVNMLSCLLGVYIIKWISDYRLYCLADGKSVLILLLFGFYGDRSLVLRKLKTIDWLMQYGQYFTEFQSHKTRNFCKFSPDCLNA